MRALFILRNYELPSGRVRIMNLIPELAKYGIESETVVCPKNIREQFKLLLQCRKVDVVIIQKIILSPHTIFLLKLFSKNLAFDFDDAIYTKRYSDEIITNNSRFKKFSFLLRKSNLVIAGNKVLAAVASPINPNTQIIPSTVETRNIILKQYKNKQNKLIIGWIGTELNLEYITLLIPTLQKLAKKHSFELRIICSKGLEIPEVNVSFSPWSITTQEEEIAKLDLGIMPLPDIKYTSGKCGYKALQYMAAGVPAIVSNVGINHEIVTHKLEGLVCEKVDDFYNAFIWCFENREKLEAMGLAARKKVEMKYSILNSGKQLAEALKTLEYR